MTVIIAAAFQNLRTETVRPKVHPITGWLSEREDIIKAALAVTAPKLLSIRDPR